MRAVAPILTTLGLMALGSAIPAFATAQEPISNTAPRDGNGYRGLTADDMNAYCLWNGRLYSVGASFCYRADSSTTCIERRASDRDGQTPATTNCARRIRRRCPSSGGLPPRRAARATLGARQHGGRN
jgi:hypothetical protein